jgi:putative nucleotidyltransferase with HDIG domain
VRAPAVAALAVPTAPDAIGSLGRATLFQGLRGSHLAIVAAAATIRQVPAGESILQAGRPAPGLIVLRRGRASRGGAAIEPGDCLEELAALDARMAEETVVATEPVECLVLSARALHDAIRQHPDLGVALLRDVSRFVSLGGEELSEQLMRYATDVRESFREGERRQESLRQSVLGSIRGLVDLAEAKHPRSQGHATRAAHVARALAVQLGLPQDDVNNAALGGLLHDIGFVVVESAVLHKPGPLSADEQDQVRSHPVVGARIIEHIDFLRAVVPYVLHHHERSDGRGYPSGLAGKAIPMAGRLMAAVEVCETLRVARPGQDPPDRAALAAALRARRGLELDRDVAQGLADLVESGGLPDV